MGRFLFGVHVSRKLCFSKNAKGLLMSHKIYVKFEEVEDKLQSGDIALFEGKGWIAWGIKIVSGGRYSHVGVVAKVNGGQDYTEILEFSEFIGSRAVSLKNYLTQTQAEISIFRPAASQKVLTYNKDTSEVEETEKFYDGRCVVNELRNVLGEHYNWKTIIDIFSRYVPFVRLWTRNSPSVYTEKMDQSKSFVCSTIVSTAMRRCYVPVRNEINDLHVTPSDLAKSRLFNYLFTFSDNVGNKK